ncbi:MAG TPA: extracellular solute-binding protein, partial [Bordetella sp.]|nr:extracellular solute-binding protein [Bordetella sp.]
FGYIDPFTARTGISVVREDTTGTPLGKLRAMVESGRIDAVLHEMGGPALAQALALNLLAPLDWDEIAPEPMFPEARHTHGMGYQYFSVALCHRANASPMESWVDFWNVGKFPGRRSLPDIPYYSLPIALLADGVPPDRLYPIDFDRAFASLDRIKQHVSVWWSSGAQPSQLLLDNEVTYAASYSGRVVGNPKLRLQFNQGLLNIGYFVMPRGASPEQARAAYGLLHQLTMPASQARAAQIISYTGNSPNLDMLLPQDRLEQFPTTRTNRALQILPNDAFWASHAAAVEKRWQFFKLGL